jgi:hypothetical protein
MEFGTLIYNQYNPTFFAISPSHPSTRPPTHPSVHPSPQVCT